MAEEVAAVAAVGRSSRGINSGEKFEVGSYYSHAGMIVMRRVFARLFSLPLYGLAAVPWLFVLFVTTEGANESVRDTFFKVFRVFAWKPNAESLNETDIAVAMSTFVLLIHATIEAYLYIKNRDASKIGKYVVWREFAIKTLISASGWTVFAVVIYPKLGMQATLIAVFFVFIMPVFYAIDVLIKYFFDAWAKALTKHR